MVADAIALARDGNIISAFAGNDSVLGVSGCCCHAKAETESSNARVWAL